MHHNKRLSGTEQAHIAWGLFHIRLPFLHWKWSVPEMMQAFVMCITGTAAISYLQSLFGLSLEVSLAIVLVHEALYLVNNLLGDPLVGGWITPALPLIIMFLLGYEGTNRILALISLEFILACLFLILGITGLAEKLVRLCPRSLKAGILVGASYSACAGMYGFMPLEQGGQGFWANPVSFSIGVLLTLYLLYSYGFGQQRYTIKHPCIVWLSKAGFVPPLVLAGIVGISLGELPTPTLDFSNIIFNPFPHLNWIWHHFSVFSLGLPSVSVFCSAIPIAMACYLIAFGDLTNGTMIIKEAQNYRSDEKIDMNTNRTHICCGIRNAIQSLFAPTCTMSGPIWNAMTITIAERYKSGRKNMDSIFDGTCTFNTTKMLCHFILPLIALFSPFFSLAMELTWMIQAFGCFYIGMSMCRTNVERGVAGITGGAIAVFSNPSVGILVGIVLSIVMEYIGTNKAVRASQVATSMASTLRNNFSEFEDD